MTSDELLVTDSGMNTCDDLGVASWFSFSFGDFLDGEISNSSKICERWYWYSSLFMVVPLFFLISTASFNHLLNLSCSVPITFASPHPMTWLCSTTWSVMADLCTVLSDSFLPALVVTVLLTLLTSALCSSRCVPNFSLSRRCNKVHSSNMEYCRVHGWCCNDPLYLLDAQVPFSRWYEVSWQMQYYRICSLDILSEVPFTYGMATIPLHFSPSPFCLVTLLCFPLSICCFTFTKAQVG